jgi:DNA repair photolyase
MPIEYISAKTALSPMKPSNYWFSYNYNMNIYRGCSHGCIYCDSRSDCYHVENFDTVKAKENILTLLDTELSKKRKKGVVGTGAMSDPYNPLEKKLELTRGALKLLNHHEFGLVIITKSSLIQRDIDILKEISRHSPVACILTITCAEDELSRKIEPCVAPSSERFTAVKALSEVGIYTGILLTPVLPFITDTPENVRQIVRRAEENGAKFINAFFGVTLRSNQRDYYYARLNEKFPGLTEKYIRTFGDRYSCSSPKAPLLRRQFQADCREAQLLYRMPDIVKSYMDISTHTQLSFF